MDYCVENDLYQQKVFYFLYFFFQFKETLINIFIMWVLQFANINLITISIKTQLNGTQNQHQIASIDKCA